MRTLARMSLAVVGLALAAPTFAQAQSNGPAAPAPHKHKRSLFGREHLCVDCQRAKVKARDGVDVPPPQSHAQAAAPAVSHGPGPAVASCSACGGQTVAAAAYPSPPLTAVQPGQAYPPMPGHMMAGSPGYAVVGGGAGNPVDGEPAPIGMVAPRMASAPMPPAAGPRTLDPSVGMSAFAPSPVKPAGANRPHVVSHLLGLSGIGRDAHDARVRRKEEAHAAISFGPQDSPVTDVPASVVYGRGR